MAAHGSNFDCASSKEIEQVIDLGVDPGRIIFANPAKFSSHIRCVCFYGYNLISLHTVYMYIIGTAWYIVQYVIL